MNRLFKIFSVIILATFIISCEKNDPLAEQGKLTGNVFPFNLLAQMPDAAAGDTLPLRTVCWAVDDNIDSVAFYHMGLKVQNWKISFEVQVNDTTRLNINYALSNDSLEVPRTLISRMPENGTSLNDFYQTLESAYVVTYGFEVPSVYEVIKIKDAELLEYIPSEMYSELVELFVNTLYRRSFLVLFPEISQFSPAYFKVGSDGFYTGEITDLAKQYVRNNLSREKAVTYLKEALVEDETRVTVESEVKLKGSNIRSLSVRSFKVI